MSEKNQMDLSYEQYRQVKVLAGASNLAEVLGRRSTEDLARLEADLRAIDPRTEETEFFVCEPVAAGGYRMPASVQKYHGKIYLNALNKVLRTLASITAERTLDAMLNS